MTAEQFIASKPAALRSDVDAFLDTVRRAIAPTVAVLVRRNMNSSGAPPPGVRSTSPRLYIRSRRLAHSFHRDQPYNVLGEERTQTRYVLRLGTTVVYARIHEYGGRTGRGYAVTLPARPYFRPALLTFETVSMQQWVRQLGDAMVATWRRE